MKKNRTGTTINSIIAALLPVIALGQAQQTPISEEPSVSPQISLSGTGIGTLEYHSPRIILPSGVRSSSSRINLSDSALMVSVSERLYRKGGIGSFVLGSITTESDKSPNGTEFFLHQLYLDYQTQALEGYIGQTDTGTRLVDFPTLRGDNLNEFVNVLNPFSSGDNVQEHRYTNQATVVLNRNLRSFLKLHAQNLITSSQNNIGQGGINSYGINYQYQELPCLTIACNTEDVDLQVLFLIVPLAGNHLCDTLDLTFLKIIFFGFSHT